MGKQEYVRPQLVVLGEAAELTQGSGLAACTDPGSTLQQCLASAQRIFCEQNPGAPGCP